MCTYIIGVLNQCLQFWHNANVLKLHMCYLHICAILALKLCYYWCVEHTISAKKKTKKTPVLHNITVERNKTSKKYMYIIWQLSIAWNILWFCYSSFRNFHTNTSNLICHNSDTYIGILYTCISINFTVTILDVQLL